MSMTQRYAGMLRRHSQEWDKQGMPVKAECLRQAARHTEELEQERDKAMRVVEKAVALVCSSAWQGISDEECELEQVLRDVGWVESADVETEQQTEVRAMDEPVSIGDYVLATKYSDGDPGDPWALGFYAGERDMGNDRRHFVKNAEGHSIRPGGFRRVERIRKDVGRWLLTVAAKWLEQSPPGTVNLWTMLTPSAFNLAEDSEADPVDRNEIGKSLEQAEGEKG